MSRERPLTGGCSCGRNTYIIEMPSNATDVAQVFFDTSHRRSQVSPLSAWLRVPLSWYHSTTYAFFDDENHNSIRRVYTSPSNDHAKRHFCGFCGTPLSYWSESPPSEAEYISLTLGSLSGSDLRDLDRLGLLPAGALEDLEEEEKTVEPPPTPSAAVVVADTGADVKVTSEHNESQAAVPWFETMLQGSNLGRMRRSKGKRQSGDGRIKVEWEIIELISDSREEAQGTGKRKLGDVEPVEGAMDESI